MSELFHAAANFWWYQFALGFCRHVPLILLLVLVVLVVCGRIGRPLGIPLLIWHERPWKRMFSGLAITLLFAEIFLVGYLLETDARILKGPDCWNCRKWIDAPPVFADAIPVEFEKQEPPKLPRLDIVPLTWYLTNMTVILLVIFVIVRLFGPLKFSEIRSRYWRAPMFLLGVFLGIGTVVGLVVFFGWLAQLQFAQTIGNGIVEMSVLADRRLLHRNRLLLTPDWAFHFTALSILVVHLIAFFFFRFDKRGVVITPVVSVCRVLGIAAFMYGAVVFWLWSDKLAIILLVLLLLAIWLGGLPRYKNRFRTLDKDYYRNPVDLEQYDPTATSIDPAGVRLVADVSQETGTAITTTSPMHEIKSYRQNPPQKRPLVLICASGGGSRSAVWTSLVLQQLNRKIPGFSHHVRLMTGASGGMLGCAYHTACLHKPPNWPQIDGACAFADRHGPLDQNTMIQRLADDALSPVVHRMLFSDMCGVFLPIPTTRDRGHGLEIAWDYHLKDALDIPFQSLAQGEQEGWRPSLILSPMFIEDGRRLLISNLDLDFLAVNDWDALDRKHHGLEVNQSRSEIEFFKLFPDATDFPLKTAVRMSASFPYISPAGVLPTKPRRRVVDAAYYDSYGVNLAAMWLSARREWLSENASKVVLIQIRDGLDEENRLQPDKPLQNPSAFARGWEWLLNPPKGALAARTSVMSYRNDEQLEVLSDVFRGQFGKDFMTTVLLENPETTSMSWYVAREELDLMTDAAHDEQGRVQRRIEELAQWWA